VRVTVQVSGGAVGEVCVYVCVCVGCAVRCTTASYVTATSPTLNSSRNAAAAAPVCLVSPPLPYSHLHSLLE